MFHPVDPGWRLRPGWSEFGGWRVHGRHQGFDYYVPRGTPVFASGDGIVEVVAFHSGGHGHFVDIRYADYRIRVGHLLDRATVSPGQRVTARTRIGTVGQSGNAAGIEWNDLIHPHVEVRRLSSNNLQDPLQVLRDFDRTQQSGGGGTPINPDERHQPMTVRVYRRSDTAIEEWSRVGDTITSSVGDGFEPTTDRDRAGAWISQYGPAVDVPRSTYINVQTYWGDQYRARVARERALIVDVVQNVIATQTRNAINAHTTDRRTEVVNAVNASKTEILNALEGSGSGGNDTSFTPADRTMLTWVRDKLTAVFK